MRKLKLSAVLGVFLPLIFVGLMSYSVTVYIKNISPEDSEIHQSYYVSKGSYRYHYIAIVKVVTLHRGKYLVYSTDGWDIHNVSHKEIPYDCKSNNRAAIIDVEKRITLRIEARREDPLLMCNADDAEIPPIYVTNLDAFLDIK